MVDSEINLKSNKKAYLLLIMYHTIPKNISHISLNFQTCLAGLESDNFSKGSFQNHL